MPPVPRIGKYELREPLGSPGLTETYRARGPHTDGVRSVAVKLLRLDRLPNEARSAVAEQFLAAGRRAAAAAVGGMARVVEVGQEVSGPFVASELVPGIDLAGLVHFALKRRQSAHALDPALACALGAQVARILTSAHESGLPHLGLSPTNVRITPAAGVVVTDFGLAASLRGQADTRLSRCFFLPPELLTSDGSEDLAALGPAADLYSLGAVVYFLLAGRPPVEAASRAELVERAWDAPPALPGLPPELGHTIESLLSPEPKQRPDSARAVADLLAFGMASAQERRQHIAGALDALGIDWRGKKGSKPSLPDTPRDPIAPQAATAKDAGLAFRYAGRRPPRRWWLLVATLVVAVAAGLATAGWLRARHRAGEITARDEGSSAGNQHKPLNMEEIPPGVVPEMMPSSIDGGIPTDRTFSPAPKRKLPRVPGHMDIDTVPSGAEIWVDGVHRGATPADLALGEGGHRVVLLKDGFRMHKDVYDTTQGEWVRPQLQPMPPLPDSGAYVNVSCRGAGRYPVFVDDEETGKLCPVSMLPVLPGQRKIAVFVPARRNFVATDVYVPPGKKPVPVTVND